MDFGIEQEMEGIQRIINLAVDFLVNYSFQVVGAIIILIIGFFAAGVITRWIDRMLLRKEVDVTLRKFVVGLLRVLIIACFIIISLSKFGISIAPFLAALGAATFGIGLALQGPISNYGAGLAIILSRPFKVGDTVTVLGISGIVEEIKLAYTQLSTEDGEIITIPNKQIIGEVIQNSFESKVVEGLIGIDYSDSPELAVETIKTVLAKLDFVTAEPKPQVGIEGFGDFSINIGVRYWVPMGTYFESKYAANQAIFNALKEANISIPFPRRDVYFINGERK